jgi:hypothetical protein
VIRPHYITPPIEEGLPLFGAARSSDPATSHAAAKRAPVSQHQQLILNALSCGPAGQTEIARRIFSNPPHTPLLPHQVNKRLTELARTGRIVETGRTVTSSSGRGEREWRTA